MKNFIQSYLFLIVSLMSCTGSPEVPGSHTEEAKISVTQSPPEDVPTVVKTLTLQPTAFNRELVANGKLTASHKANLKFRTDGLIDKIHISEGSSVAHNQLLATLYTGGQEYAYLQLQMRHKKALLDYDDQLLRQGYRLADTTNLQPEVKLVTRLRSGLSDVEIDLLRAQAERENHYLYAPFAGKIANLKAKAHNSASAFEYICTLVDDRELHVEFLVLEQELGFIRGSKTVTVSSFSNPEIQYPGQIISINPLVDQGGMVSVKALIRNTDRQLLDGMGVRVVVNQSVPDQLLVPKEAVLERQGRRVVFTATADGLAYWNYVEIGQENSSQFTIKDGLKPGDNVIYEGNFNLAHDKPILLPNDHPNP